MRLNEIAFPMSIKDTLFFFLFIYVYIFSIRYGIAYCMITENDLKTTETLINSIDNELEFFRKYIEKLKIDLKDQERRLAVNHKYMPTFTQETERKCEMIRREISSFETMVTKLLTLQAKYLPITNTVHEQNDRINNLNEINQRLEKKNDLFRLQMAKKDLDNKFIIEKNISQQQYFTIVAGGIFCGITTISLIIIYNNNCA